MSVRYDMGFSIDGVAIPDPSKWEYEVADLDVSGERDTTGLLHRDRVATKTNYSLSWSAIKWTQLQAILAAVRPAKFTLSAPDPRTFNSKLTGQYYVGNRSGEAYFYHKENPDIAVYSLSLKLIEY